MILIALILIVIMISWAGIRSKSIPDSLSYIAYIVPKWLFSIWIMILGILIMPDLMSILNDNYQYLGFLIILGLFCVAASPHYKTEQSILHYSGAVLCFIFVQLITILINPYILIIWTIYPLIFIFKLRKWWVLIAELISFIELTIICLL